MGANDHGYKLIIADLNTDSDKEVMIDSYWVSSPPKAFTQHANFNLLGLVTPYGVGDLGQHWFR